MKGYSTLGLTEVLGFWEQVGHFQELPAGLVCVPFYTVKTMQIFLRDVRANGKAVTKEFGVLLIYKRQQGKGAVGICSKDKYRLYNM